MIKFFVPMVPPRTTHQTKSVRIVKGKPVFFEPAKLAAARAKLVSRLAEHVPDDPYIGALEVVTKWIFPTTSAARHGSYKTTRPDGHNLNKLLFDVMTDLGYWKDDALVCREIIEKFWSMETPGIWISIRELE